MKKFTTIAAAVAAGIVLIACSSSNTKVSNSSTTESETVMTSYKPPITGTNLDKYTAHPKRLLVLETKQGTIKLQLFEKVAPGHVENIIDLAKTHFYDGVTFHRVIPGFMIQGGDPNSKDADLSNDGTGNGPRRLKAEFNEIHHAPGILSAARTSDPNSASCQFFICTADAGFLDRQYTVFGQVVEGMDVAYKIVELPDARGGKADPQAGANPGKAAEITKAYIVGE